MKQYENLVELNLGREYQEEIILLDWENLKDHNYDHFVKNVHKTEGKF